MSYRLKTLSFKNKKKTRRPEEELHVFTNPFLNSQLRTLDNYDYEAPLTAKTLAPNSKWIIVRENLHKIRSWRGIDVSKVQKPYRDWYVFFQMRRELRRAQYHIKQVEQQENFTPVRYFYLPIDANNKRRYNVSHIQPSDAIYYPGLGREPIVLQSLLYYFTKECAVPYDSTFRGFLGDVCSIIYQERQRLERVAVFRKVALFIATIVLTIIGLMLFSLILSVFKTTSDFRQLYDNDLDWTQPETTLKPL